MTVSYRDAIDYHRNEADSRTHDDGLEEHVLAVAALRMVGESIPPMDLIRIYASEYYFTAPASTLPNPDPEDRRPFARGNA